MTRRPINANAKHNRIVATAPRYHYTEDKRDGKIYKWDNHVQEFFCRNITFFYVTILGSAKLMEELTWVPSARAGFDKFIAEAGQYAVSGRT